ncbi:hypothetical protein ANN_22823 [Periplaneta americana]|uniref:Uncharacterized protein n=1 Tax=Periplaneta americana TaxID=6978 RepID=A0ABQ8SKM7_PERAM|nr:hypothetical protein ANN_22823 [Periplaneta americana]
MQGTPNKSVKKLAVEIWVSYLRKEMSIASAGSVVGLYKFHFRKPAVRTEEKKGSQEKQKKACNGEKGNKSRDKNKDEGQKRIKKEYEEGEKERIKGKVEEERKGGWKARNI